MKAITHETLSKVIDSNMDAVLKMCNCGLNPYDIEEECGLDWMQRELSEEEKGSVMKAIEWRVDNGLTYEISMGDLALSMLKENPGFCLYALLECWGAAVGKWQLDEYKTTSCTTCDEIFGGCPSSRSHCIHSDNEDFLDYLSSLDDSEGYREFCAKYDNGESFDAKALKEYFEYE